MANERFEETCEGNTDDDSLVHYTPEQRALIRKGLRIWARVAVRSYMRRQASFSRPQSATDDNAASLGEDER